jgi:hypothetical protein
MIKPTAVDFSKKQYYNPSKIKSAVYSTINFYLGRIFYEA